MATCSVEFEDVVSNARTRQTWRSKPRTYLEASVGPLEQRRRPKRAGMRHEQWPHGDDGSN